MPCVLPNADYYSLTLEQRMLGVRACCVLERKAECQGPRVVMH